MVLEGSRLRLIMITWAGFLVANYPLVTLDARYGHKRDLNPITTGVADDILTEAITEAKKLGVVDWNGQILKVSGNDDLKAAASEEVKKK